MFRLLDDPGGDLFAVGDNGGDHGIGALFRGDQALCLPQRIGNFAGLQRNAHVCGDFFVQFRFGF